MATLSVLYVIRNEQENIEKSLLSIKPIADEIIVVDSGSFDKSLSIIRKFPYTRIFSHAWIHDYSAIKNYGVKQCKCDWILSLDGDEMLDIKSASMIKTAVNNAATNIAGFALHIVDHETELNPDGPANPKSFFLSPQTRVFRKHPKILFTGRVQESVTPNVKLIGGIDLLDARVHHHLWHGKGEDFKKGRLAYYTKLGGNFKTEQAIPVPPPAPTQTAIVMCAYNALPTTRECMNSITTHTHSPYNLYLVDNGSSDGTLEYMKSVTGKNPVRFINNAGISKGRNAGAREALSDPNIKYICFLDNDIKVTKDWLQDMTSILERNPKMGLIGPLTNTGEGIQNIYSSPNSTTPLNNRTPEFLGAENIDRFCMVMPIDVPRKIGLFDETFGTYGFEEKDFCQRVKQAGYEIAIANKVFVEHRGKTTVLENKMDWQKLKNNASVKFFKKWSGQKSTVHVNTATPKNVTTNATKFSFVILTCNRLDMTKQCIQSILDTTTNFELVIVDNGSTDGTVQYLKTVVPDAIIIENPKNLGIPVARNQGIRATSTDYIVVMDNDIVLKQGWYAAMFDPVFHEKADMVGLEGWQLDYKTHAPTYKCQSPTDRFDYLGGAMTIFKRRVFEEVGLLDEGFGNAYFEDSIQQDRLVPIRFKDGNVNVLPIEQIFELGKKTQRADGKEESRLDGAYTLSVNPEKPSLTLDSENLPDWWAERFLSGREREVYNIYKKNSNWPEAEKLLYGQDKGYVRKRIQIRLDRSEREDAFAEWKPINKLIRHKTNKDMVLVNSRFGQTICTTDHSIMSWDNKKLIEKVPSQEVLPCSPVNKIETKTDRCLNLNIKGPKKDDTFVILHNINKKYGDYSFPHHLNYKKNKELSKNLFFVLGMYCAEGYSSHNNIGICTTEKQNFKEICNNIETLILREANKGKAKQSKEHPPIRGKEIIPNQEFMYIVSICNKHITKFFVKHCGEGAKNKKIPSFIYTAPEFLKKEFLRGLFKGDAYNFNRNKSYHETQFTQWYKNDAFKFSSTSLALASGVCLLLSTLGKRFSVGYDAVKGEYKVGYIAYRRNTRKQNVKVTNLGPTNDYVYDIEVEDNHTFLDAMGFITLHNTDFSVRAKKLGMKLVWQPTNTVHHKEHATLINGQKDFKWQDAMMKSHQRFAAIMRGELKVEPEKLSPPEKKLKILYAAMYYDYGVRERGTSFEQDNFYPAFRDWNRTKELIHFDYVEQGRQHGIAKMSDMLYESVLQNKPDVIFMVPFNEQSDPRKDIINKICKTTQTKVFSWFCDSHSRYENFDKPWANFVDYCITTSTSALEKYQRDGYGSKVIKSQWAAAPNYHYDSSLPLTVDVSFIGQPHGDRRAVIDALRRAKIDVKVFGTGWNSQKLSFDSMVRMFTQSRINLSLNNACDLKFKQIKGRNFETPACGGFLLTGTAENLYEYYTYGKEIATYESTNELIEKIRYYLNHEEERVQIAKAGYERTMRDHTYANRFNAIFTQAGLL